MTDDLDRLAARLGHVPDRTEIAALLRSYFVGPISEAVVDRVEHRVNEIQASSDAEIALRRSFQSPTRWRGQAWYEEHVIDRQVMTPADLVGMMASIIASDEPSFPAPRLHTPAVFAGTWVQLEPTPTGDARWQLEPNGDFHSTSAEAPRRARLWCVELAKGGTFDQLVFRGSRVSGGSAWALSALTVDASTLTTSHYSLISDSVAFRFRR